MPDFDLLLIVSSFQLLYHVTTWQLRVTEIMYGPKSPSALYFFAIVLLALLLCSFPLLTRSYNQVAALNFKPLLCRRAARLRWQRAALRQIAEVNQSPAMGDGAYRMYINY